MLPIPRSAIVAAVSVATGGALYGVAADGVVGIDRELQASVAPPARIQSVEFRRVAEPEWSRPGDCPRRGRSAGDGRV
jgi:hypothetical protein